MEMSSVSVQFLVVLLAFFCITQLGCGSSVKVVVDGDSQLKNPVAQIGDSVIFSNKNHLKLFIFKNEMAFSTCNFTQATLLSKPIKTESFTWNPTRPGMYYFSFSNGTSSQCEKGQKISIKVLQPVTKSYAPASAPKSSPAPISGGVISSSPSYNFPGLPHEGADSPTGVPGVVPQKGGIAIIDSNPAVPLSTDAADSTSTTQTLHTSLSARQVVRGFLVVQLSLCVFVYTML